MLEMRVLIVFPLPYLQANITFNESPRNISRNGANLKALSCLKLQIFSFIFVSIKIICEETSDRIKNSFSFAPKFHRKIFSHKFIIAIVFTRPLRSRRGS
jgi:hypothetical protein